MHLLVDDSPSYRPVTKRVFDIPCGHAVIRGPSNGAHCATCAGYLARSVRIAYSSGSAYVQNGGFRLDRSSCDV